MQTMEASWDALLKQMASAKGRGESKELVSLADTLEDQLETFVFYDDHLPHMQHLVHYTSWERALAILRHPDGPVLRMYNYERSNDPQEGKLWRRAWGELDKEAAWLDDYLPEHEKTLRESGQSTGSTYGCSFSSDVGGVEDNLTFWRLYGNDGEGCSFKVTGLLGRVYRVRYLNEDGSNADTTDEEVDRKIAFWLRELITSSRDVLQAVDADQVRVAMRIATGIRKILGGYQHLAKSRYFEDEREWRMIEVAPKLDSVQYDVDEGRVVKRYIEGLSLKDVLVTASSITVGPRVPNGGAARAYVEHLIRERDMRIPEVKLSRQVYRPDV